MDWNPSDWCKQVIGVDPGEVLNKVDQTYDAARAAVGQAYDKAKAEVTDDYNKAKAAVADAYDKGKAAVAPVIHKAESALGIGGTKGAGGLSLSGSVGRGGKNDPSDVKAVQRALGIGDDGKCGTGTIKAIEDFQRSMGQAKPDGRVDPGGATSRALQAGANGSPAGSGSSGILDGLKDLGSSAVQAVGGLVDDAEHLGSKVLQAAKSTTDSPSPGDAELSSGNEADAGVDWKLHGELSPKKPPFEWGKTSRVKAELTVQAEFTGEVVEKGTENRIKAGYTANQGAKAEIELGKQKGFEIFDTIEVEDVKEVLNIEGSKKRVKLSLSVEGKIKTRVSWLSCPVAFELKIAEVEWEKLKEDPEDITVIGGEFDIPLQGEGPIPLTDAHSAILSVKGYVAFSAKLNWPVIFAEAAKKGIQKTLEQGGKVTYEGAIDVIITSGLVVAAIMEVAGTYLELAKACEEVELRDEVANAYNAYEKGLGLGLTNEDNPGDPWGSRGWKVGRGVFDDAIRKATPEGHDWDPDDVEREALKQAQKARASTEVQAQITQAVGVSYWKMWIAGHHGPTTFLGDAKRNCGFCFRGGPARDDDPHLNDWREKTCLPDFMK